MVGSPATRRSAPSDHLASARLGAAPALSVGYLLAGVAWVLASEWLVHALVPEERAGLARIVAGLGLVALSGVTLYLVLERLGGQADAAPASVRGLRRHEARQRRLAHRLMEAEEDTRRSVAKDLHDGPLQALTLTFMQLDAAARGAEAGGPVDAHRVTDAMNAIRDAADDIRAVVRALHPPLLAELGLAAAVERHCRETAIRAGRDVLFEGASSLPPADTQSSIAVFRILQEALANALKHTSDGPIEVDLQVQDGRVHLSVRDHGPGFEPGASLSEGLGLLSMRERAESVGGAFVLQSGADRGTAVSVHVPLNRPDA
ncbi:MAG: sensor histidine kinase [Dehalococcoidia bacterium]|nr:sensor histidine kinase [Dehalococcoidia bacterium]